MGVATISGTAKFLGQRSTLEEIAKHNKRLRRTINTSVKTAVEPNAAPPPFLTRKTILGITAVSIGVVAASRLTMQPDHATVESTRTHARGKFRQFLYRLGILVGIGICGSAGGNYMGHTMTDELPHTPTPIAERTLISPVKKAPTQKPHTASIKKPAFPSITIPTEPKHSTTIPPESPEIQERWGTLTQQQLSELIAYAANIRDIPARIRYVAERLIGTPYKHAVMSSGEPEKLVVDFDGMNCLTFVETVLAAANSTNYQEFVSMLRRIRYKSDDIHYLNRNHYMVADWIPNSVKHGLVYDATSEICPHGELQTVHKNLPEPTVDRKFSNGKKDPITITYIPSSYVASIQPQLKDGDIILFVSPREDLDVRHVGVMIKDQLLHAKYKQSVTIEPRQLAEYLMSETNAGELLFSGIIVIRPR